MRKILLTFSLLLGLLLVSCSSNNPKVVAEKFLKAVNKLDFAEAKKYCDKDTQDLLSLMESFSKGEEAEKAKTNAHDDDFIITKVEENGDKAKVYYKTKESEKETSIDLKKVDGKWLVSINKEQGMKEQGGGAHNHDEDDINIPEEDDTTPDDAPEAKDSIPAAQ